MTELTREEVTAGLADIEARRMAAFRDFDRSVGHNGKEALRAVEDATTQDDIDWLNEARKTLDPYALAFLHTYVDVWQSFGKYRCSVCGMTPKQAKDANYNCAYEC